MIVEAKKTSRASVAIIPLPDGRECILCEAKDTDEDDFDNTRVMMWVPYWCPAVHIRSTLANTPRCANKRPCHDRKRHRSGDGGGGEGAQCEVRKSDRTGSAFVPTRVLVRKWRPRWAYPPCPRTRKNRGMVCYYCNRVFTARFKAKFRSIDNIRKEFGENMETLQLFRHWRGVAVEAMMAAGSRDIIVKWGEEQEVKRLLVRNSREARLEEPEMELWEP